MSPRLEVRASLDLAVVVVSYNTRALTLDCLRSVYRELESAELDSRVWVVDNASADESSAAIARDFPQAILIASKENLGFAGGTNLALHQIGALAAQPRHVLLLNPDTLVEPGALRTMVRFLDGNPHVGVAGAQLCYADGRFQHGAFRFPTLAMAFLEFWPIHKSLLDSRLNGRYPRARYEAGSPFPIDHPLGAAMMVRWEVIAQHGMLDDGFFMYCEEVDWCMRIKKAGWSIYCVPQARVAHLGGQSAQQFRDARFVALWRSRFRLFRKHYGRTYQIMARAIVRAGLARSIRQLEAQVRAGTVAEGEARSRIGAYRTVMGT